MNVISTLHLLYADSTLAKGHSKWKKFPINYYLYTVLTLRIELLNLIITYSLVLHT